MKKIFLALLLLLFVAPAWGAEPDGKISYATEYDPAIHNGILMIQCDDWAHTPFVNLADSLNVPISFMLSSGDNPPAHANRAKAVAAWAAGCDIGGHYAGDATPNALVKDMTNAQIAAMFQGAITTISDILGTSVGGPLGSVWTAQSWAYYGNDWTENSVQIGKNYYEVQRVRYQAVDSSGVAPSAYPPFMSHTGSFGGLCLNKISNSPISNKYGRGQPIIQSSKDRLTWQQAFNGFSSSAEAADDTTGMGAFLKDIADMHLISVVNIHPGGDASYQELSKLYRYALARGDIWITDARRLMSNTTLSAALNREITDTLYVSNDALATGLGTWDDPVSLGMALQAQWTHPVKFKSDQVYYIPNYAAAGSDLVVCGAITVEGPSTLKFQLNPQGATDMTDAATALLKIDPSASTIDDGAVSNEFKTGVWQRWKNIKFESHGNAYESSFPSAMIQVAGAQAVIDSCVLASSGKMAIRVITGGDRFHLLRSTATIDTTTAGCGVVAVISNGVTGLTVIGNSLKTTTGSQPSNMIRRDYAISTTVPDTLANNFFWNATTSTATTNHAISYATAAWTGTARFNVFFGGNIMRTRALGNMDSIYVNLAGTKSRWGDVDTALCDLSGSVKHWTVNYAPTALDTMIFGGMKLGPYYTYATRYGSVGPTQYTEDPFVSNRAVTGRSEYSRFMGHWPLLRLINNGVLPASQDSTEDKNDWYSFYKPTTPTDIAQYKLWIDEYFKLAKTAQKILWNVEGQSTGFQTYYGHYRWLDSLVNHSGTLADSLNDATWHKIPKPLNPSDELQLYIYKKAFFQLPRATRNKMYWKVLAQATNFKDWDGYWPILDAIPGTFAASDEYDPSTWFTIPKPRNKSDEEMLSYYMDEYFLLPDATRDKMYWKINQ